MSLFRTYFAPGTPTYNESDVPDVQGKVFIITGGTGGVGLEIAKILYATNASRIYLLGRSPSAMEEAIDAIRNQKSHSPVRSRNMPDEDVVRFLRLDLSDLASIKQTARVFLEKETRLDVLWHNAAIMLAPEGSRSEQGHELSFATNVLGPFLLQHFLTPILLKTSKDPSNEKGSVRVCWATSGGAVLPPGDDGILWENLPLEGPQFTGFQGRTLRYMQSKVASTILAAEMAKRHPEIISSSYNPGALKTGIARHAPGLLAWFHNLMASPARYGGLTAAYAAFSDDILESNGGLVVPFGHLGKMLPNVEEGIQKRDSGGRLWDLCDDLVHEHY
ncbi:Short-chain dehydrogenase/reductase eriB [Cladobotryum mycophilum]|uniref:Short-chain dehydrogenase/reductase eriB n=1 Tax=Cladobotryum mycophilum TaxID=491253 RepID=A0ABR0SD36_9HYPO